MRHKLRDDMSSKILSIAAALLITCTIQAHTVTQTIIIKKGDTLASIFEQQGLSAATLEAATAPSIAKNYLEHIRPRQTLIFTKDNNTLNQLIFPFDRESTLTINKTDAGFKANIDNKPVSIKLEYKSATIKHSFAQAANNAGLSAPLSQQLINIFQGSINFRHNIKPGDHFGILFQEYYVDGKKDHPGDIIVSEFTNKHKTYKAIRYTYPKNHTGYYTPDGHGVQPLFLSAPLHYKRISSHFTYHRFDPYLKVWRPHLGVDYAAPIGTPIKSIGEGRIIFRGKDHGYGNAIIIRFSRKYEALYGHMERFAHKQHTGSHVHRGEVIGYVGSTGWSTGPHLHFGMYVYGKARDPLKMKFPGGHPVPAAFMQSYLAYANNILDRFNLYQGPELAQNGNTNIQN